MDGNPVDFSIMNSGQTNIEEAYAFCKKITVVHYENFPVASFLLPGKLRKYIYPVYAFARYADDLADEGQDRTALLEWREQLHQSFHQTPSHPIFIALKDTIQRFKIPLSLLDNLLTAFLLDLDKKRHPDLDSLFQYCQYSANPVGRIILYLFEYRDENLFQYSDNICTALQLTNFWQDVSIDLSKNRIYIPQSYLKKYHLQEEGLFRKESNSSFKEMMKELVHVTQSIYLRGMPLLKWVRSPLRWELQLTILGGMRILKKIKNLHYDVLDRRPTLSKVDWATILSRGILIKQTAS